MSITTEMTDAQLAILNGIDSELLDASVKLDDFSEELVSGKSIPRGKAARIARGLRKVIETLDGIADRLDLLL